MKTLALAAVVTCFASSAWAQECQGLSLGEWGTAVAPQYGVAQDASSLGGTGTFELQVSDTVRPGFSVSAARLQASDGLGVVAGQAFGAKAFAAFNVSDASRRYPICAGFAFSHVSGLGHDRALPVGRDFLFFDLDLGRTLNGPDARWDIGAFATPEVSYTQLPSRLPADLVNRSRTDAVPVSAMKHDFDLNLNVGVAVRVWRVFARVTGSVRGLTQPVVGGQPVLAGNLAIGAVL